MLCPIVWSHSHEAAARITLTYTLLWLCLCMKCEGRGPQWIPASASLYFSISSLYFRSKVLKAHSGIKKGSQLETVLPDQHLKKDLLFHSHRQSKHILGDILEPQDRLSSKFCHICPKWAQEISQPYGKYNEFISADHRALTVGDENCR